MTPPAGLIDFFIGEATEHLDRLRSLLAAAMLGGRPGVPDGEAFASNARTLRGAATMARLDALADLALALERVGRETAASRLAWDVPMHTAVAAALDDIREMLPATRQWAPQYESRVRSRTADLVRRLPADAARPTPAGSGALSAGYLANELASLAEALESDARGGDPVAALQATASRARALRGIAGLDELPLVGGVLDAVDRAASDEWPQRAGAGVTMVAAASRLLARTAADLRAGRRSTEHSDEARDFAAALAQVRDGEAPGSVSETPVVPIESLFYADAGPHVVAHTPGATITRDARFRRELLPHAEHLRRLVADASAAADDLARPRIRDDLRRAVRSVAAVATSFGASDAAESLDAIVREEDLSAPLVNEMLEEIAARLTDADATASSIARALEDLRRGRTLALGLGRGFEAVTVAAPSAANGGAASAPARPRKAPGADARRTHHDVAVPRSATARRARTVTPRTPTPTGQDLHELLSHGIAGFQDLEREPLSEPAALDEMEIVPIDVLLYRGRAALERARELRDQIRSRGEPRDDTLGELFDLLDLATAE